MGAVSRVQCCPRGAHPFLMSYLAARASDTTGILKFFSQRIEMLRKILSKIMTEFIYSFFKKRFYYLFDRQRSQVGREAGRERKRSRLPAE